MSRDLSIRNFDIREADWRFDQHILSDIRRVVFIVEQQVPKEEEWDGRDPESWHWLATAPDGRPIGTARLLPEGQIGRMAVLSEYRGAGVGAALLERAVAKARHLGFELVFLNAQSHALSFYRKAGFIAQGDEFEEAGIAHFRMTRGLSAQENGGQKFVRPGEVPDVAIRAFDAAEVEWPVAGKIIRKIRELVLVHELGLNSDVVTDEADETAFHWQAVADHQVVGCVRMNLEGTISRLAVLESHRRQGVGHALLELAVGKAQRFGYQEVKLMALTALDHFYRDEGFLPRGEKFEEQGHEHQEYFRTLVSEEVLERTRTAYVGDDYGADDVTYRLGQDDRLLLLRKEEEFRNVILEMCKQANASIRIYSPVLEHKLFDNQDLREICSALARRNKYTRIEVLIYDSHRVVKNGHALLELSRKLPSSMGMRIVDPELRTLNHEYVLVDDYGLIYRHDYEGWDGYANFDDQTECNRFGRQFKAAWESGQYDPNLRHLRL
ncbi:MAG: GNAT family N-acetyltransferase [Pseudomonadales bacterium]